MKRSVICALVLFALACAAARSQELYVPAFAVLGDSLGEGVQSADAGFRTQPSSYANLVAQQMRATFPLPLIISSPTSNIFSTTNRTRILPGRAALNLAVSGATIHDLLNNRFVPPVDTETDLVLMPRTGSQIEIAEQLYAAFYAVWIGGSDVEGAVLHWQHLDASQMTDLASFTSDYAKMISRLQALGTKVVVGTIPDVTQIGFLISPQDLIRLVGWDFGLPQGSYTTLPVAILLKLGFDSGNLIQDPNYVLDPQEIAAIQTRIQEFNRLIIDAADFAGLGVVDIYAEFLSLVANPPVFYSLPLTLRFQGGLLSMDGVHPSNIGHALAANAFIQAANTRYGMQIPLIDQNALNQIAAGDPFIDWNGNQIVRGRPLAGLEETLGPFLGISGDFSDGPGSARVKPDSKVDKSLGDAFKAQYLLLKGLPASTPWTRRDAIAAISDIFGQLN